MSASVLREAAAAIRERQEFYPPERRDQFMLAVAAWLDAESEAHIHRPAGTGSPINLYDLPGIGGDTPGMRVATAYLERAR